MPTNRFIMYLLILAELGLVGLTLVVALVASDWRVHVYWRRPASLMAMSLGVVVLVVALFDHYVDAGLRYVSSRDFFILNTKLGQLSEQSKGGLASSLGTAFLDNLSTI